MKEFKLPLVIFIPTYNCEKTIAGVLKGIPASLLRISNILVVDNQSSDGTISEIRKLINEDLSLERQLTLIQPDINLGYAGSQKLAYQVVCQNSNDAKWVAMLHGDGQYDPHLLQKFEPFLSSGSSAVYGFRVKKSLNNLDETPLVTYAMIKFLSALESVYTGIPLREWHTGFLMYSTAFLKKVNFAEITSSPHIDGQMLALASTLDGNNQAVEIYKYYKDLVQFSGMGRIKYIFNMLKLYPKIRAMKKYSSKYIRPLNKNLEQSKFKVII